uniref:Uncharacterized protein n=1 Tax=Pristionchus pacificus TaxID=54126 RepID=A0A8R1YLK9_PRIPA
MSHQGDIGYLSTLCLKGMLLNPEYIHQINGCWRQIALYTRVGLIDARALRIARIEFRGIPSSDSLPLLDHLTHCFDLVFTYMLEEVLDSHLLIDLIDELVDEQDAFLAVNGDPTASEFDVESALAAYVRAAEEEMEDEGGEDEWERPLWQVPLIVCE